MSTILRAALTETVSLPSERRNLEKIREANLQHHRELIVNAANAGVQVICLGELFPMPYFAVERDPFWRDAAEDAHHGPSITMCKEVAQKHQIAIVAPIYEIEADSGRRFNTAVVVNQTGSIVGKYRKTHIPAGENEQSAFHETFYYEASNGDLGNASSQTEGNPYFPVFDLGIVQLGVSICYDRHFPGVAKALSEAGAQLIMSPAVTFGEKSRRMWDLEFPVDAARHNVFIGGSNRCGSELPWKQEYFGASYFVGPNGTVDSALDHEHLVVADLDLRQLSNPDPSGWNLARDRRACIY